MELQPHHHTLAAYFFDDLRIARVQFFKTFEQIIAGFRRIIDKMLVVKHIDRFDRGDAGFTNAAERCHGMDHRRFWRTIGFHIDIALGNHRGHRRFAAA